MLFKPFIFFNRTYDIAYHILTAVSLAKLFFLECLEPYKGKRKETRKTLGLKG